MALNIPVQPTVRVRVCTWGAGKELSAKHEAFFEVLPSGETSCWHMHADGSECRVVRG